MEFQSDSEPTVEPIGKAPENMPFPIPEKWKWVFMGNVTKRIHYGFTASAASMGNAKFLRITDIQNGSVNWASVPYCDVPLKNLSTFQLHEGNIVIARTGGTIGKSYLILNVEDVSVFASYLIRLIPSMDHLDPQYAMIFLNSPEYWLQLKQMSQGTGQPNVNTNSLSKLRIPIPPLGEQQRIVTKIKSLLAEIDRAEKAYNTLTGPLSEQYKALILDKAMRGQLVPQLDSEPEVEQMEESLEDVPFEIPKKWKWLKLSDVTLAISDGSHNPPPNSGKGIPVLSAKNIFDGKININQTNRWVTEEQWVAEDRKIHIEVNDVLLTIVGTIGRTAVVRNTEKFMLQRSVAILKPNQALLHSTYLALLMTTQKFMMWMNDRAVGTAQKGIYLKTLKSMPVPVPPLEEQYRIVKKLELLLDQVGRLSV